jgi:hypothetical protein
MNKRISVLVIFAAALVILSIFTMVRASSRFFVGPPPKHTAEAQETARVATAAAGPHAPKPDLGLATATEPASCPHPGPKAAYVGPVDPDTGPLPFFASEVNITSEAISTLGSNYYSVWVGAPGDNPNQGLIRVLVDSADPCASRRLGTTTPTMMTDYTTPRGPLTAIKVEGNILFYNVTSGGSGRFNFVTGQFLP